MIKNKIIILSAFVMMITSYANARDQIKIDHFSNLVSSKSKNLYKILKLMNANTSYKGNFTYVVKEKVYFILLTKNGRFTTNFI